MKLDHDKPPKRHSFKSSFMKMPNVHFKLWIAFLISCFCGYVIGTSLDWGFGYYPLFTVMGVLGGAAGVLYKNVFSWKRNLEDAYNEDAKAWQVIEVTVEDVRKAVRVFSDQLPQGVYRTILVKDDHSIDFEQLAAIMKGIPSRKFYMSKETYDIFEENEKEIAITIDNVQKAVDLYVKENKQFPMLPHDPLYRVNYYQQLQAHCLDTQPDIELYITNYDGLVTHIKPKKNSMGN